MGTTVVTTAGLAAAAAAGTGGPLIAVTQAKLGSTLITPSPSDTNIGGTLVFTTSMPINYQVLDNNTIQYSFVLDESMGSFAFGNVGLFLADGTLFALTSYNAVQSKTHTITNTQIGNRITIRIQIRLSGLVGITNLSVNIADEASLPEVANQGALPSASIAPFNAYLVRAHSGFGGRAVIATRISGAWQYMPSDDGSGGAVTETNAIALAGKFDAGVDPGKTVYWNAVNSKFELADATNNAKLPIGIRGASDTFVGANAVYTHGSNIYTTGQKYYATTGGNLTTTPNAYLVGVAIAQNMLLVLINTVNGQPWVGAGSYTPIGKKLTTYLPANAWYATRASGSGATSKWVTPVSANSPSLLTFEFPKTGYKFIETESIAVKSIDKSVPLKVVIRWLRASTDGAKGVLWALRYVGLVQGVAISANFANQSNISDVADNENTIYDTAEFNLDISGISTEATLHFQLYRGIEDAADTLQASAYFHSIFFKHTPAAESDV